MNKLTWELTEGRIGPPTTFGVWEGVRVFSMYPATAPQKDAQGMTRLVQTGEFIFKCDLPGWHNKELPRQKSIQEAKNFAERTLTRWVAKRGLLFKDNIVVTDAMAQLLVHEVQTHGVGDEADAKRIIKLILEARG